VSPKDASPDKAILLRYGKGEVAFGGGSGSSLSGSDRSGSNLSSSDLSGWNLRRVAPPAPARPDPVELLERALAQPVGSPALKSLASRARSVVVSIPDATRPPVAKRILAPLVAEIVDAGVSPKDITIFVASGVHSPVAYSVLRGLAGESLPREIKIVQNDARAQSDFRLAATTSRGTPVVINKLVADAGLNVIVGTVAFHYFAGMGGGRKMVVPGASSHETVRANHRLSLTAAGDIHPGCRSGKLEGNPVHEDMTEGTLASLGDAFLVNLVVDGLAEIADIVCGDLEASYMEAVRRAKLMLEVRLSEPCDVAVASAGGHPLDLNLIQAHKSIDHAAAGVRDGGVVIALAECSAGVGSETFLPWFDIGSPREVSARLAQDYQLNGQTALSLMKKLERLKIILVSALEPSVVERTGIAPARDLGEAVSLARSWVGQAPLCYVMPAAWGILPVVQVDPVGSK
jgi:nickel-dependent lactate racemase